MEGINDLQERRRMITWAAIETRRMMYMHEVYFS